MGWFDRWRRREQAAPAAATRHDGEQRRGDGWINALTGIGLSTRDKRLAEGRLKFEVALLTQPQAEALWRGDDMGARIVETLPNEMLREGFLVSIQPDPEARRAGETGRTKEMEEALMARLEELEVRARLWQALAYERAYGGAGILLGADDGTRDLALPLGESIRRLTWLNVLGPDELVPVKWYANPQAPQYGQPETYRIQPRTLPVSGEVVGDRQVEVHESRLLLFPGIRVSRQQTLENNGWGDSALVRVQQVLADYHQTWAAAAILLQDFSQAVLKIKGLAELIATNQDDVVIKRAQAVDMSRSTARAVLIDAEEEFERKQTPMAGLPELLDKFANRLAAAADMPVTLLMGQAPAGLNATGESDIRFFYDRVRALQSTKLRPALERLVGMLLRAQDGPTRGVEPENWSVVFRPLWQLSEVQHAEIRNKQADTDVKYIDAGVLSPEEVAVSRFGGDTYSTETVVDFKAREALVEEEPSEPEPEPEVPPAPGTPPPAAGAAPAPRGGNGSPAPPVPAT